jgi:hypothetical protein
MQYIIITTSEEIEAIIKKHLSMFKFPQNQEENEKRDVPVHLHSIKALADFLDCSIVTAQKLKNSGKIRYKQFGRKVIFNTTEVLEDLGRSGRRTK